MKKAITQMVIFSLLLFALAACSHEQKESGNEYAPNARQDSFDELSDDENGLIIINGTHSEIYCNETDLTIDDEAVSEIMEITSFDGYTITGRLTLPKGEDPIPSLVIFVNDSGQNTYLNRLCCCFNFFDIFADKFSDLGIAFFSYSTRGVSLSETPPLFFEINEEAYQTYLPLNSAQDIYYMINALRKNERLTDSNILLLGSSEGTIIAPLVAEKYPDSVDGLFLWGYVNQNLRDVLIWQNIGGPSMVWYRAHFETNEQGQISKEAFEADPNNVVVSVLQNTPFGDIDLNNDGYLCEEDFAIMWPDLAGFTIDEMLSAIEHRDDEWIRTHYGGDSLMLTSGWFLEHFSLRSNMEVLPMLDLPIYIFHGTLDQNVDVREVFRIYDYFQELGKTNLTINIFENHCHSLNFQDIILHNTMPDGLQAIFDAIAAFK